MITSLLYCTPNADKQFSSETRKPLRLVGGLLRISKEQSVSAGESVHTVPIWKLPKNQKFT